MARTLIATNDLPMNSKITTLTWTAADASNGMYYVDDGNTILLVDNGNNATNTVTQVSVADKYSRTGDLAAVCLANDTNNDGISIFGLPTGEAWRQAGTNQISVNLGASTKARVAAIRVNRFG